MISESRKIELMRETIALAANSVSEDQGARPKVGALLADNNGKTLATSFRSESSDGDHAEYVLLSKAADAGIELEDAVLFVTLEPCTTRGPGKTPCAERIRQSRIRKVFIGMLDPNPQILGHGETQLRWSDIEVDRFPSNLIAEIEDMNEAFVTLHRQSHLPTSSLYVTTRISDVMTEHLQRAGVDIDELPGDWDLTLDDLSGYCELAAPEKIRAVLPDMLRSARADAFDKKYADYSYTSDARGLGDFWKHEIRDLLALLDAADYARRRTVIVGIGNGQEAVGLFDSVKHLSIVDIGRKSLKKARRHVPTAIAIVNDAERLADITTGSQDIYLSLRTYQSAFFDISAAVRQAYRVVRQGGLVVTSVSNGFIGEDGALIPGHILPKSATVDQNRPFQVAEAIRRRMTLLRFEGVGVRTGHSEIYVYGRRAR